MIHLTVDLEECGVIGKLNKYSKNNVRDSFILNVFSVGYISIYPKYGILAKW